MRRVATSANHQAASMVSSSVEPSLEAFQAMESLHHLTIWRFSAHGDRLSQDLRTVMQSLHEERTMNVRKASVFDMRFPSSSSSDMSKYSAAHLSCATLVGFRSIGTP